MPESSPRSFLDIPADAQATLISGARDASPVSGLTHKFYKYPARFSPVFARAAIDVFTQQGDLCLDPYVGGGTTLVEALAAGRNAIGIDISELAHFVSLAKTAIFDDFDFRRIRSRGCRPATRRVKVDL